MNLRWLVKKYPKPTIEEVRALREETAQGMMWCKKQLSKPDEKVLQMYVPVDYHEMIPIYGWVDVPVVEEIVDEQI